MASPRVLIGGMLLVIGVLWAGFAWRAATDDRDFEGAPTAEATVLDIQRRTMGAKGASQVVALYRFQTPDGVTREAEDYVPASEHSELDRTKRAQVQYLPADPTRSRLFFPWMTASTAARANRGEIAIVVTLLGVGGLLVRTGWSSARRQFALSDPR